ncbi:MAG: branched-chain amino acid ABC transporter permease [Hamadaea sp.]|uniref:branched-chain amino acid ABC transporter permease n=1 Tax=Hamadaea sp. TaxID=2024425 RepID=UPI0017EE818D|nr:branched-chain amino acid ABC transporter permease [Hamadaea sp.]NUR74339.1 branched-chain amino acid ABC transporter permease [Hamadaea sp.]NUT24045.1 branched-chain amino acid ABC transporter permease [Hamadaea sp.]
MTTGLRHLLWTAAAAAALLAVTYAIPPFRNYQLATAAAYLCATAGLTVLVGLSGQLSLGHGAVMAVGAYAVALSQNRFADAGLTGNGVLAASLALGVLAALVAGLIVGLAAARLRGPYLAGVTLAVAVALPAVTTVWAGVFHSDQGLSVYLEPPPAGLGYDFPLERWQAWLALAGALLVMLLLANLVRSRFGRSLRAVRDDEVAARLAGIDVARTQVLAFVVSAGCAGLGGGLMAVLTQSVSPGAYSLTLSLFLLMAVVVGGLGRLAGAVWGALLLVVLPDLTHTIVASLTLSPAAAQRLEGNLPLAVFGLTLIVVMIAAPGGISGVVRRLTPASPLRR